MSYHTGKIILNNEDGLIGAAFDLGLRNGPDLKDPGTFRLPKFQDRKLAFDLCVRRTSEEPWHFFREDLKDFFKFTIRNEAGEVEVEEFKDARFQPDTFIRNMVHYVPGRLPFYHVFAGPDKVGSGKHNLTIETNPAMLACAPARFYLEINQEDIWQYQPPEHGTEWLPFRAGVVELPKP